MSEQPRHESAADFWGTYWPRAGEDTGGVPDVSRIHWTQYPHHGPGVELLGAPKSALEIGAATCVAGVALARTGVEVTCVDFSPYQMERARGWWAGEPNVQLVEADVLNYLAQTDRQWDCVFSNWGAAWFIDPEILLPLVLPRLEPGGVFAFSCVDPLPPCFGPQILYGNGYRGEALAVVRWMLSNEQWTEALERHGFVDVEVTTLSGPEPGWVGTTMGRAYRP
jgi:SAM-dependent methyltransferase